MITELSSALYEKIQYFVPRLLLPGLHWGDIVIALSSLNHASKYDFVFWHLWFNAWEKHGNQYETDAMKLMENGKTTSANEYFLRAAACYHWAEFMFFYQTGLKEAMRKRVTFCFERAMDSLPFSCQRAEVPYKNILLPGYLLFSSHSACAPCVILMNGLDSAKEVELFAFAKQFFARGLSVFIFDGPGQGLLLDNYSLPIDFENVILACIKYLTKFQFIDSQRIGLFGVSFGGYLALRCASILNENIKACINLSGGFDIENFGSMSPRIQQDFMYVFKQRSQQDMIELSSRITLNGLASPVCPILCIQGGYDTIFTSENGDRVMAWCKNKGELLYYANEAHVCQNYFHEYIPYMADWMREKLYSMAQLGSRTC